MSMSILYICISSIFYQVSYLHLNPVHLGFWHSCNSRMFGGVRWPSTSPSNCASGTHLSAHILWLIIRKSANPMHHGWFKSALSCCVFPSIDRICCFAWFARAYKRTCLSARLPLTYANLPWQGRSWQWIMMSTGSTAIQPRINGTVWQTHESVTNVIP